MAKTAQQRQADYRARRREQGLCLHPGCPVKVRKYARCAEHRREQRELAAENRGTAADLDDALFELKRLRQEKEDLERRNAALDRANMELRFGSDIAAEILGDPGGP